MKILEQIGALIGEKIALVYEKLKAHTAEKTIHRTSAEIRAEITDQDIPSTIARDAAVDKKILVHDENGDAHPGLLNSISNIGNGTILAGRSEYAQKLGDAQGSYTKAQLDVKLDTLIHNVTYDAATAKFSFHFAGGRVVEIDTPLENTVKDGHYDAVTAELVLVLISGQEIRIPAAGLTKIYTGKTTATTATSVNTSGEISADLRVGAVEMVHLSAALQQAIGGQQQNGDTKDCITTFADQPRSNLASGDKHSVLFGKIKRWFSDLGVMAFRDNVSKTDLTDTLQGEINGKCDTTDPRLSDARPANGGNADTLDGRHADDFKTFVAPAADNTEDPNTTTLGLILSSHANSPDRARYWYIQTFFYGNKSIDSPRMQIAVQYNDANNMYIRNLYPSQWSAWERMAKVTDIPASLPANGGNADTVDGRHAHNFLASTNGVHTGALRINPTDSGYAEGIRISRFGGWANVQFGSDANESTGLIDNQWIAGTNPAGAFSICLAGTESGGGIPTNGFGLSPNNEGAYFNRKRIATIDDIPTTLPAVGGNADTVDGLHAAAVGVVEGGKLVSYDANGFMNAIIYKDNWERDDLLPIGLVGFKTTLEDGYHRFCSLERFKQVLGTFITNRGSLQVDELNTFTNRESGTYAVLLPGAVYTLMVFKSTGSTSAVEILSGYEEDARLQVRKTIDSNRQTNFKDLAWLTDIPTNFVTTDTTQTISGAKTFAAYCDFPAGAGNSGSDMRFKKHIAPVGSVLHDLLSLHIIQYTWDKSGETQRDTFGLSASQLIEKGGVFQKTVHERPDDEKTKWVEYDRIGVLAVKAIQELHQATTQETAALKQEIADLRQQLSQLRETIVNLKTNL